MRKIFVFVCLLGFGAAAVAEDDYVLFKTNLGNIVIDLYPEQAEITVDNFIGYVEEDFYDGLIFHRTMENFMIQAGAFEDDLTKREPTSGPIVNESDNGLSNLQYTIAMARTEDDPDSATSQFFINLIDNPFLDRANADDGFGHAVFGKVVSGMDVVDAIALVSTHYVNPGLRDVPNNPVIITSATVIPEPATILLLGLGCLAFVRRRGARSI